MLIEFFVEGTPKAQPRPRAFARRFANGKVMARVYDPGTAEGWKSEIALAARKHIPKAPIIGPIKLTLVFTFARPTSHFGTGKNASNLKPSAPEWHTSKPDLDNLNKSTQDCLTALQMWRDDSQVVEASAKKRWVCMASLAGAKITIEYGESR